MQRTVGERPENQLFAPENCRKLGNKCPFKDSLELYICFKDFRKRNTSCAVVLMWMFANDSSNVAILDHSESGQHHTLPKDFKSAGG